MSSEREKQKTKNKSKKKRYKNMLTIKNTKINHDSGYRLMTVNNESESFNTDVIVIKDSKNKEILRIDIDSDDTIRILADFKTKDKETFIIEK